MPPSFTQTAIANSTNSTPAHLTPIRKSMRDVGALGVEHSHREPKEGCEHCQIERHPQADVKQRALKEGSGLCGAVPRHGGITHGARDASWRTATVAQGSRWCAPKSLSLLRCRATPEVAFLFVDANGLFDGLALAFSQIHVPAIGLGGLLAPGPAAVPLVDADGFLDCIQFALGQIGTLGARVGSFGVFRHVVVGACAVPVCGREQSLIGPSFLIRCAKSEADAIVRLPLFRRGPRNQRSNANRTHSRYASGSASSSKRANHPSK